jgi:hypothetical protein
VEERLKSRPLPIAAVKKSALPGREGLIGRRLKAY